MIGQENGKSHLQKTQEEVEEVKVIMLQNMNKAEERSGKLNELEDRADLKANFEKTSTQVKTQKRWANKKMKVMLIAVAVVAGLIILSLIIVAIVQSTKGSD
uniref:V-SNARE coiled-coil homology domain-containing protein n=1 Tax=Haplochromis burtoni TaxID=8153 RepID=A0A3Q2W957_HAPBU